MEVSNPNKHSRRESLRESRRDYWHESFTTHSSVAKPTLYCTVNRVRSSYIVCSAYSHQQNGAVRTALNRLAKPLWDTE
eukprot:6208165-Pleurochrysis_carterae.AAC.6